MRENEGERAEGGSCKIRGKAAVVVVRLTLPPSAPTKRRDRYGAFKSGCSFPGRYRMVGGGGGVC
jgi:hypothetical protein